MVVEIIKYYKTEHYKKITDEEIKDKQVELDKLILENQKSTKHKLVELDKLILENQQKIDYYKSLKQQIIDVNKEKELIKEEKRKIAKQKRKFELEQYRINDIDVDKFINSMLK